MMEDPHSDARVRQLIEAASDANARGRAQDAELLLRQAHTIAPGHPLVINEVARQRLSAGDAAGAYELLKPLVQANASQPNLWLNYAAALRGLGRADEEMDALNRVLSVEPRNARAILQKASLQEIQGNPRIAAATYRSALELLPPSFDPPPSMRPVLQHAKETVAANDRALESFLEERLAPVRSRHAGEPLGRFERCLSTLLRKQPVYRPQPSFMYFPQLPALEFYDRSEFPWLDTIEAATEEIRFELLSLLNDGATILQPYVDRAPGVPLNQWAELNRSRRWGVHFLWKEGIAFPDNIARCPRTVAALDAWPRYDVPGCGPTAVFSILDAQTRIPAHTGVSNTRLIVHLPLVVPPGCEFRVGSERREWVPGKALVFDDTIEHEAYNGADVPRAVLILDVWNPFLSPAERDLVRTVSADVGEYYGIRSYQGG